MIHVETGKWLWQKILKPVGSWCLWFVLGLVCFVFGVIWCFLSIPPLNLYRSIQKARTAECRSVKERFAIFVQTLKELTAEAIDFA